MALNSYRARSELADFARRMPTYRFRNEFDLRQSRNKCSAENLMHGTFMEMREYGQNALVVKDGVDLDDIVIFED